MGDPFQAIYKFNDSSPEYMTDCFIADYDPVQYSLDVNFRSSSAIIEAAKKIEPNYLVSGRSEIVGEVIIKDFENEEDEAEWILNTIESLLEKEKIDVGDIEISPEQIAIIARN